MRPGAALALALVAAGCAPAGGPAGTGSGGGTGAGAGFDAAPARPSPPVPTATGVDIPGTGREIGFGRHLPGAEAALARVYGAPARRACGAGTVLTLGALELHFEDEAFAGWRRGDETAGRPCAILG